jgi:hypothetical protein
MAQSAAEHLKATGGNLVPITEPSWTYGLREMVERHEKDLYRGNGLPGITTRMQSAENRLNSIERLIAEQASKRDTKLNLVLAGILTIAGALVLHFLFHVG